MRTFRSFRLAALVSTTAALTLIPQAPAWAHEKWFVNASNYETNWDFFFEPLSLAMVAAAAVAALIWRFVFAKFRSPEIPALGFFGRLAPWVPRLLGIHLGVSLLAQGVQGTFLAPALSVHELPGGDALAFFQAALGAWFISGFRLRIPAVILIVSGPLALLISGPVSLLEAIPILGIAGFLLVLPPTSERWGAATVDPVQVRRAMQLLRLGVGLGLIVLAFSEKFANPSLAQAILDRNPELNVAESLGLGISDEMFIRIAGTTELLFGLLVLSGAGPQLVVIVAAIPFNLTLLIFGETELIGHLPVYGAFLALIVYGSRASTSRELASFKPPSDKRPARATEPS